MKVDVNVPVTLSFDDYHEIMHFVDDLRKVAPSLNVEEIGCLGRNYMAIVYKNKGIQYLEMKDALRRKIEENEI